MADGDIFRYFEFAEESTPGVAETTPEMSCDAMSISPGIPDAPDMEYKGSMGRGKTIHRPGFYSTSPKAELGTDLKILSRMLYFALGNKITKEAEGTTGPDTSTQYIYAKNGILLPTFTGWFGIDIKEYKVPGCVINKLEFSVEKDFFMLKPDMAGMAETPGTLKTQDQLLMNEDYPLAFYEMNVHMRNKGSATPWGSETLISRDIKKMNLGIENSAKAEDGQGLGSRFPYYIPVGERKIGLEFDYTYLTNKWYDLMQGGSNGPQAKVGSTEFEMRLTVDAGEYGSGIADLPRVIVTKAPIESKGRDPITQGIAVDAYQDNITIPTTPEQTVYSEILWTMVHNFPDSTVAFDGPLWAGEEEE